MSVPSSMVALAKQLLFDSIWTKRFTHFQPVFFAKQTGEIPSTCHQGCQMAYFQTKDPKLGQFWRVLPTMDDVGIGILWIL
jgi:hypothetical protein